MTVVAQGINKVVAYKKQTGIGVAASGSGGQQLRRVTATFNLLKDTFDADEIVSHQQDTGIAYGVSKTQGAVDGALSAGTYGALLASLCRTAFASGVASTGLSITIAGTGPYTLTRSTGSYLTDGYKVGDVVRITAGTYTGTARDINLVIQALTATVATVLVANGSTLSAQGPIASSTLTVMNKKATAPTSGQANDYYTFEEWFSDLTKSRTYVDTQMASADISIAANGNSSIKLAMIGLSRVKGSSQVLTTPTAATTTAIVAGGNAFVMVNAGQTSVGTSLSLKIDGQVTPGEPVIGSKVLSDNVKGDLKVSGTVTLLHTAETTSDLFVNETAIGIVAVVFADNTPTSDFISFNIPAVKLTKDDIDDGKKQLVMTCDFVGQYNAAGGAALASDTGIITIQDSAA